MSKDIFNVAKFNNPISTIISLPFIIIAIILICIFWVFAFLALIIGRRFAFNILDAVMKKVLGQ